MDHEITEINGQKYVTVFLDENNARTFPTDMDNPDYVQFLKLQNKN